MQDGRHSGAFLSSQAALGPTLRQGLSTGSFECCLGRFKGLREVLRNGRKKLTFYHGGLASGTDNFSLCE